VGSPPKRIDTSRVRIPGTNVQGWRAIAVGALALYILVFVVLNNRKLEVNFVFFTIRSNELLALVVIVILSFTAGFIAGGRRQRARPGQSPPRGVDAGSEATTPAEPEGTTVGRGGDRADPG
jgi:uncharacterized integral membrane protein